MSHQVIITFDIDENKVQENAEKEAGRQIARDVVQSVFDRSYNREAAMSRYVQNAIKEMLEPEKDRIIQEAIKEVVSNLHKTKAVRERMLEAVDGKERP